MSERLTPEAIRLHASLSALLLECPAVVVDDVREKVKEYVESERDAALSRLTAAETALQKSVARINVELALRKAAYKRIGVLETALEAARPFADDQTCLDPDCGHKSCVLNKALAVLVPEPAAEETGQ